MYKDLFDLTGKVAVVTGGAGGIGEALAEAVCAYGAKTIICSRNMEKLRETAEALRSKTGGEVDAMTLDVTSEESVKQLMKNVVAKYGKIDILINSMGINIKHVAMEYPMEDWDKMFAVNVKGTMICCKYAGRYMKAQGGGNIINLSSVRGVRGMSGGNVGYAGTKAAVELITKSLALEWAEAGIRVNALAPALIITPGTKHVLENPELAKKRAEAIPLKRLGMPDDMMAACVFLAGPGASFVTGQTIFVDGGSTAG